MSSTVSVPLWAFAILIANAACVCAGLIVVLAYSVEAYLDDRRARQSELTPIVRLKR